MFLYAGAGDTTQIDMLRKKYPNRVFLVPEREDFYQIIEKCLFYLNTYPMFGGLMMRFAANAGKLPLTLKHDNDADGILMNQQQIGIEYDDLESILADIDRIIENKDYRKTKEKKLKGCVMTEQRFAKNIKSLIENHTTEFTYKAEMIDTQDFRREYLERFNLNQTVYNAIVRKINKSLIGDYPLLFSKGVVRRLLHRVKN